MVFVTGNIKGDIKESRLSEKNEMLNKLKKRDYVIILGNSHIIKEGCDCFNNIEWLNKRPFTTVFLEGNEDDHLYLNSFSLSKWHNGKVHKFTDSVIHLISGYVYSIGNRSVLAMGGGDKPYDEINSKIDRPWLRLESQSRHRTFKMLKNRNYKVTHILSHVPPKRIAKHFRMDDDLDHNSYFLEEINRLTTFDKWYFKHNCKSMVLDDKFTCVSDDIIPI